MTIQKSFECKDCGWKGRLKFYSYRDISRESKCPKCNSENLKEQEEMGKFGTEKHLHLIKHALLKVIDNYYVRHAKIIVENHKMSLSIGGHGEGTGVYANRDFYPDIAIQIEDVSDSFFMITGKKYKKIFIECETALNNLLSDKERMVAYTLLKLQNPDLAMYLVLPSKFKGKIEKPEFFNDIWYFDLKEEKEES